MTYLNGQDHSKTEHKMADRKQNGIRNPNTIDHPKSERVRYLSPHCRIGPNVEVYLVHESERGLLFLVQPNRS